MGRLASLRVWIVAAMISAGAVGGLAAYAAVGRVAHSEELAADRAKTQAVVDAIANELSRGASTGELAQLQRVLPNAQLIVERDGVRIFTGPTSRAGSVEVTVTAPIPRGHVTLVDHESAVAEPLVAIAAGLGVAALVSAAALLTAGAIARSVRTPVERAVSLSGRIAAGDLQARVGRSGPGELSTLGVALDDMAARLEDQEDARRRFLADVTHEVATPLHTIVGYATAISDGTINSQAEHANAQRAIASATDRVNGLLTALRETATLDLFSTVHTDDVNVADVCAGVAARFELAATEKHLQLDIHPVATTIRSDRRLIDTILDNLVSNAIRYTPTGGRITLTAEHTATYLTITVNDTGIGISPHHQRLIFDHLYRVDHARTRNTGGLGLGLTIARRAATAIGGNLTVTSTPSAGSQFTLSIPPPP